LGLSMVLTMIKKPRDAEKDLKKEFKEYVVA
jgi:hypothetical protein